VRTGAPGSDKLLVVPEIPGKLPDFVTWPSFPFEGDLRVKPLEPIADVEPRRDGEDIADCPACAAPDDAYIWVSERWRVRAMDRPSGLPMVLILESRSHLDLGDLPNLLAAELGVMTVRLERAIRSLDGVARVHVNRWGDGSAHLHLWFLARPTGRLQLRGPFLSLWNDILPAASEEQWRENLALIAAWLAEFGGRPLAEPPRIQWQAPSKFPASVTAEADQPSAGDAGVASGEASPLQDEAGPAIGRAAVEPQADKGMTARPDADTSGTPGALADAAAEPAVATPTDATPASATPTNATPTNAGGPEATSASAATTTPLTTAQSAAAGPSTEGTEAGDSEASTKRLDRPADRTAVPAPRASSESAEARATAAS
jgi:hypothetical protein